MIEVRNKRLVELKLSDLASKEKRSIISGPFGSSIGKRFFVKEGTPVIRGNNLSTRIEKFIDSGFVFVTEEKAEELKSYAVINDLIFTAVGTIGQVAIIGEKSKFDRYVISNKQLRVRLDERIVNPLYAYYWYSSPWIQDIILKRNVGSTVPLINLSVLKSLPILLPKERKIQDTVVNVLEAINNKIELNNHINAELERMAKLIYDYWFVQFDFPTSAAQALALGKPEMEGKPYKSSGGKMVYNKELKREIPEGWGVQPLMKFGDVVTGKTPSVNNPEHFGNSLPFFTPVDFSGIQKIKITAERGISLAGELAFKRYVIPKKSILITCIGSDMGKVSINYERGISNQQINSLKPFNPSYVDYLYQSISLIIPYLKTLGKSGSTVPIVNKSTLERINFINPPIDIVKSYNELTEPNNELIAAGLKQKQQLSSLRDWLLPMLMNGQVKVGEVAENLSLAAEPEVNYGG